MHSVFFSYQNPPQTVSVCGGFSLFHRNLPVIANNLFGTFGITFCQSSNNLLMRGKTLLEMRVRLKKAYLVPVCLHHQLFGVGDEVRIA